MIGNSEGAGVSVAKLSKGKYKTNLEIPGGRRCKKQITILGRGMDIFWDNPIDLLGLTW